MADELREIIAKLTADVNKTHEYVLQNHDFVIRSIAQINEFLARAEVEREAIRVKMGLTGKSI